MLMEKERRPPSGPSKDGQLRFCSRPVRSANARSMGGRGTQPIAQSRERAVLIARQIRRPAYLRSKAVAAIEDLLDSTGDTCPECPLANRRKCRACKFRLSGISC